MINFKNKRNAMMGKLIEKCLLYKKGIHPNLYKKSACLSLIIKFYDVRCATIFSVTALTLMFYMLWY